LPCACRRHQLYPPTELLTATKLFFEYIPADIVELLGLLRPDNFR